VKSVPTTGNGGPESSHRPVVDEVARTHETHRAGAGSHAPEYRYGVVFVLMLALVLFVIVAPADTAARAVATALEGAALVVVIATSRARPVLRRRRAAVAAVCAIVGIAGVATEVIPEAGTAALTGLIALALPPALVGGLLQLVRERGVTLHAVAGTLAIYLLIGLVFSSAISFVARIDAAPYFAQGTSGTDGQRMYYSFTVLTTTGFGDLSAATPPGRALAVLEMLLGQLYLVTVIGVVVANFRGRRTGFSN
jgi:ion channel